MKPNAANNPRLRLPLRQSDWGRGTGRGGAPLSNHHPQSSTLAASPIGPLPDVIDRQARAFQIKTLALLKQIDLSPAEFYALDNFSYEQYIAIHSLEQLKSIYTLILSPGLTLVAICSRCPEHPPGSPHAGQKPSRKSLTRLRTRLLAKLPATATAGIDPMPKRYSFPCKSSSK